MTVSNKIRSAFDFKVVKRELTATHPVTGAKLETPFYGMFRDDNWRQVGGAAKAGYVPHTVDDICVLGEAAAAVFGGDDVCEVDCYWTGTAHEVVVAPPREFHESIANKKDVVWPRVHIRAGYDGTSFRANLGLYRHACSNLMIPRLVTGTSASIWHTASLRPRIDDLREMFSGLCGKWADLTDELKLLDGVQVDFHKFVTSVFGPGVKADKSGLTKLAERRVEAVMLRVLREKEQLGRVTGSSGLRVTLWEAVNAVQGYIQHEARRGDVMRALIDPRVAKCYEVADQLLSLSTGA